MNILPWTFWDIPCFYYDLLIFMGCASIFFIQGKDAEYRFQKFFTAFFRISNCLHLCIHLYCFLKVLVILLFSSQIILYAESFSTFMFMEIGNIEVCQSVKYFHFPNRKIFISVKKKGNYLWIINQIITVILWYIKKLSQIEDEFFKFILVCISRINKSAYKQI